MKTPSILSIISTLTLVAGCAHHEQHASYDETVSSPAYSSTTYNSSRTYNSSASISPDESIPGSSTYISQPAITQDYSTGASVVPSGSDATLTAQVQQSIYNDSTLVTIAPQIHVIAQGGTIVLSGKVPSEEQKQIIEQRVKQTSGVVSVNNQLQVSLEPTGKVGHSSRIYSNSISQAQGGVATPAVSVAPTAQVDLQNKSFESKQLKPTSNSSATRQYGTQPGSTVTVEAISPSQPSAQQTVEDKSASPSSPAPEAIQSSPPSSSTDASVAGSASATAEANNAQAAAINAATSASLTNQSSQNGPAGAASSPGANTSSTGSSQDSSQSAVGSLPGATQSGSAAQSAAGDTAPASASTDAKGSTTDRPQSSLSGASTGSSSGTSKDSVSVQVQGTTDSDRALGQQITQQLRTDSSLAATLPMLHISIDNGKATLHGNVKSEAQKKQVESIVQQVTGVSSVENQLRVSASTSGTTNP